MSRLIDIAGDLFDFPALAAALGAPVDAIGHGVNCVGKMGSGIAVPVRQRWPIMYTAYAAACARLELIPGDVFAWRSRVADPAHPSTGGNWIYNLATQHQIGRDARLDAIEASVTRMLDHAARHGVRTIALPRIGAGIGGLDWAEVRKTIASCVDADRADATVAVVTLAQEGR